MKRIIYIVIAAVLLFTSCDDFLTKYPKDNSSPDDYFKTKMEVEAALTGVYDILGKTGTYGRTLYFELDMSDEGFNALSQQTLDLSLNDYDNSDVKVLNLWSLLYEGISRANYFLVHIDNATADITTADRDRMKGEVSFLRSYYYFLLVSNWGDVPFRLAPLQSTKEKHLAKTDSKIIYAHILKEMEDAYELVDYITKYTYNSRVTKSVVAGILARVNLKMGGYPLKDKTRFAEARKWALKAMEPEHGHKLNPDYKQIFINHCKEAYDTKECIWEVEFGKVATGGQEEEGSVGAINGIGNSDKEFGYSYAAVHVTERYFKLFEPDLDLRRDWTINTYYYGIVGGVANTKVEYPATSIYNRSNAKWRREYEITTPKNVNTTPINFPILRFSDVLLMFAEADNEVNNGPSAEAIDAVNQVRERAYGLLLENPPHPDVDPSLPANMDYTDFKLAIQKERSLELGFEALRRHDLIRWELYLPTMSDLSNEIKTTAPSGYKYAGRTAENTAERHLLLPIPSNEMALNNLMTQNKGW